MKTKRVQRCLVALSCLGMLFAPSGAFASNQQALQRQLAAMPRDVALADGGVLFGQIVDPQGKALAGRQVTLQTAGRQVIQTTTDNQGRIRVAGLTGGVYQVTAMDQQQAYRLWAPQTAPPAAQRGLMIVQDKEVVRGQCDCGTPVCGSPVCGHRGGIASGIGNWMDNHPVLTAGAVAAAIAVPLALDDDDTPATP